MAQLMDSSQKILLSELRVADSMWSRLRGLLGTRELSVHSGLWIHQCNSIHTFFMNYAIDCVFVDRELKIKALKPQIAPGRMVLPIWGADSVFEMSSGSIARFQLRLGDQLHVGA